MSWSRNSKTWWWTGINWPWERLWEKVPLCFLNMCPFEESLELKVTFLESEISSVLYYKSRFRVFFLMKVGTFSAHKEMHTKPVFSRQDVCKVVTSLTCSHRSSQCKKHTQSRCGSRDPAAWEGQCVSLNINAFKHLLDTQNKNIILKISVICDVECLQSGSSGRSAVTIKAKHFLRDIHIMSAK